MNKTIIALIGLAAVLVVTVTIAICVSLSDSSSSYVPVHRRQNSDRESSSAQLSSEGNSSQTAENNVSMENSQQQSSNGFVSTPEIGQSATKPDVIQPETEPTTGAPTEAPTEAPTQPQTEVTTTAPVSDGWKKAYRDVMEDYIRNIEEGIKAGEVYDENSMCFLLVHVNNDEIPELVMIPGIYNFMAASPYTFKNGAAVELPYASRWGSFSCKERSGFYYSEIWYDVSYCEFQADNMDTGEEICLSITVEGSDFNYSKKVNGADVQITEQEYQEIRSKYVDDNSSFDSYPLSLAEYDKVVKNF